MRRKLFAVCSACSLLLFVAVCVLWARSGRRSDYVSFVPSWRAFVCFTFPGGVKCSTWPRPVQPAGLRVASLEYGVRNAYGSTLARPVVSWSKLGFDLRPLRFSYQAKPDPGAYELFVPFWFLAAASLVPPAAWIAKAARFGTRVRANRCPACGYDLRATPERCPECGAAGTIPAPP